VANETAVGTLGDLRLSDLVTFLIVARTSSVTAAARELKVAPSQASKAIARLEQHYRVKLLTRSPKGMALSEHGKQVMPHIADAVKALTATAHVAHLDDAAAEITIAGPSYLIGIAVASIAAEHPALHLRGIELAPAQLRATLTESLFDIGLSPGGMRDLPPTWVTDKVGALRKILLGPPDLVRGMKLPLRVEDVRALPFIGSLSTMGGRFAPRADDCPLPVADRIIVHRVQTFGAALELSIRARCVTFGPWIAARRMLRTKELVELPVVGWNETEDLELVCNGDVVRERTRQQIVATLRRELAA